MSKTLSLTWFYLLLLLFLLSLSFSLSVLVHIFSQVFLCGVLCFYHMDSAAVHCHDYFAWLSLLAHLLGDRPLGSTWLGASCGVSAPVGEWGGLRETRGVKSFIFKVRGLSSFIKWPVIHPFFICTGSHYVFSCLWACDSAAVGDGRAADQKATPLVKAHRTGA